MISQISFLLFILANFYLQNQVLSSPVLLWSNVNLPKSAVPLSKLSSHNLISDYICKLTNDQVQLRLFAVNDLTSEDIHESLQNNHPVLLDAKKEQTNFRYYPHVSDDAHKTFSLIPQSNNAKCSHINFEILSSNVYDTLHDALNIIQATIDHVEKKTDDDVIIALINSPADKPKPSRRRRQTINETQATVLIENNNTCMFYAKQLRWNPDNGSLPTGLNYSLVYEKSSCKPNVTSSPNGNYSSIILDLTWRNDNPPRDTVSMRLNTTLYGQFWYLTNITLNGSEYRYFAYGMYDHMRTPPRYSYVCTIAPFVRYYRSVPEGRYNFSHQFYLLGLQFQPFNVTNTTFGPPNYCTSFFTSGIWMGITSSLLCLAILLFGIHRMMTIKSNDRFDDPKAKPLIIKAQE